MITIVVLGLDPYLLRQISKLATPKLAELYECKKDDIDFFSPEGLLVHDGVEQNTWNINVRVSAPLKVKVLEDKAVKVIRQFLKDTCVNMEITFNYYSQDNHYVFLSEDHPRFITEENSVYEEDEYNEFIENNSDEEPYLGDIFEEFNKNVEDHEHCDCCDHDEEKN